MEFLHFIDLPLVADTMYRRLEIQGMLIPGGLQTGPFDWGMIRLPFRERIVHVVNEKDLPLMINPEATFADGLATLDVKRIFLGALLTRGEKRWQAVDVMIRVLPELPPEARRAVMEELYWLTGVHQGYDANRWIDWWDIHRRQMMHSLEGGAVRPAGGVSPSATLEVNGFFPARDGVDSGAAGLHGRLACLAAASWGIPGLLTENDRGSRVKASSFRDTDLARIRDAMNDAFFGRRYSAVKKLQNRGAAALAAMERLLEDESPRVRKGAAGALEGIESDRAEKLQLEALAKENEPGVRLKMVQVLALRAGKAQKGMPDGLKDRLAEEPRLKAFYNDMVMMVAMESILHFDSMPGFYDGQFSALWELTPDAYTHLSGIVHDPDVAFQMRVMAIMALQERKNPSLAALLKPLILDPARELDMEYYDFWRFRLDEKGILEYRRRNLSKYARFSLAKAGFTRFNLEMIRVMENWINKYTRAIFHSTLRKEPDGFDPLNRTRRFGKNLILSIGYNYQQYDQYEQAEDWYRRLLSSFPGEEDAALQAEACYNLACLYSITDRKELAVEYLELAVHNGFMDLSWMTRDRDLDSIRDEPEYEAVRQLIIDRPADDAIKDKQE